MEREKRVSSRARHGASELVLQPPMNATRGDVPIGSKRQERERASRPGAGERNRSKRQQFGEKMVHSLALISHSPATSSTLQLSRTPPMESQGIPGRASSRRKQNEKKCREGKKKRARKREKSQREGTASSSRHRVENKKNSERKKKRCATTGLSLPSAAEIARETAPDVSRARLGRVGERERAGERRGRGREAWESERFFVQSVSLSREREQRAFLSLSAALAAPSIGRTDTTDGRSRYISTCSREDGARRTRGSGAERGGNGRVLLLFPKASYSFFSLPKQKNKRPLVASRSPRFSRSRLRRAREQVTRYEPGRGGKKKKKKKPKGGRWCVRKFVEALGEKEWKVTSGGKRESDSFLFTPGDDDDNGEGGEKANSDASPSAPPRAFRTARPWPSSAGKLGISSSHRSACESRDDMLRGVQGPAPRRWAATAAVAAVASLDPDFLRRCCCCLSRGHERRGPRRGRLPPPPRREERCLRRGPALEGGGRAR